MATAHGRTIVRRTADAETCFEEPFNVPVGFWTLMGKTSSPSEELARDERIREMHMHHYCLLFTKATFPRGSASRFRNHAPLERESVYSSMSLALRVRRMHRI